MKLFTGNANRGLAERVAGYLGIQLGSLTCKHFADGEIQVMVDESARGNDVYIIEGLTGLEVLKGKRVMFSALPLPIPGGSGCPVRAVAWEPVP